MCVVSVAARHAAVVVLPCSHRYTGHAFSEDPEATHRLSLRLASGHTRLRSHVTAPASFWEAQQEDDQKAPAGGTSGAAMPKSRGFVATL